MSEKSREDIINEFLKDDAKKNALDFVAYLRANEIAPPSNSGNIYLYQNRVICKITIKGADDIAAPWMIWFSDGEGDKLGLCSVPEDERLKEFAWAHINTCANFSSNGRDCGCDKAPGRSAAVFGRQFDNVCHSTLSFINPNADSLVYIKKLVDLMKIGINRNNEVSK